MKLKKILSNLILVCLIFLAGCSADTFQDDKISLHNLREGDLMFVVKETSNPITDATQGINGLKIDHVAIFHHTDSADYALEAYGKPVALTPLFTFLNRSKWKDGKILDAWAQYYAFYHREVPEGEPGTNPGQLSRDKAVKVTYEFQTPSAK